MLFENTSKFFVLFQKIFVCTDSKIENSFSCMLNSLINRFIISSTYFDGPSILIAVRAPLWVKSLNVKLLSNFSG